MGHLVPEGAIPDQDKDRDQLVAEIFLAAKQLSEQMGAFKRQALGDVGAFVQLVAEKYGAEIGGVKGNVTLESFDGRKRVVVQTAARIAFTEAVQAAKALLDKCVHRWTEKAGVEVKAIVEHAFAVDRQGQIVMSRVLGLMRLSIDDDDWRSAMAALRDSLQAVGTATYVRVYERTGPGEEWRAVPLSLSAL